MSRSFLLQDWVTIRGGTSGSSISVTQDEECWLDLSGFSDAACWIDVAEVTPPGGLSSNWLTLSLETSAVCDEAYFSAATPPVNVGTASQFYQASTTPIVTRSAKSVSTTSLARYLRWKITPSTSGVWDLTFRIRAIATRSPAFVPTLVSGCQLWLRSDLGVTLSGSSISSWKDQSGSGNDASPGTSPGYAAAGVNNLPKLTVTSGQYLAGSFGSSVADHTLFAILAFPGSLSNAAALAATNSSNTVNSGFAQFTETPTGVIGRSGNGSSFTTASTSDTSSLGTVGIYTTAAKSGGTVDLTVNGTQKASVSTAFTMAACPKYLLFTLAIPTQYNFVGDAYEFIVYSGVLSAADRTRVSRYLGARYGIAVP